jgi:ParB-like nuclease domain
MNKPNIQIWPVERLVPYAQNVKKHGPESVKRLAKLIAEMGWTQPIVVDKDGVIIAGHGRRLAALELKHAQVPVWVRDDLDEMQVRALRLADNRVVDTELDTEMFRRELADLDFDLTGIFDAKELQFAVADLGEVNLDAFVDDVGAAVSKQEQETKEKIDQLGDKPVPIARVFGFKQVKSANQIHIARLMSEIERITGAKGEDALVAYWSHLQRAA